FAPPTPSAAPPRRSASTRATSWWRSTCGTRSRNSAGSLAPRSTTLSWIASSGDSASASEPPMSRVVVLGSSGYDLTIRLARLPRAGGTLLGGDLLRGPGGKGANAAIAARRAGAEVTFLTAFGDDDFGRLLVEHDTAEGLDLSFAKTVPGVANQ